MMDTKYTRGSEWRKWDLHIHTPASFHWEGRKFNSAPNSPENTELVDEMIHALNAAEPAVFAIMDYWTFDGWFALKRRLGQAGAPKLEKTVFPGIELRLVAPMDGRLNAHVLFSNDIDDQVLHDFRTALNVALIDRPLSDYSLKHLARQVGEDLLRKKGFKKSDVDSSDETALLAGSTVAEVTCESYKQAIRSVPDGLALGFMPFNTNDGLADVKWQEHYAYVLRLFDASPIFETRTPALWAAFAGVETDENRNWIGDFQYALGNIPRLAVSGSDAHRFTGEPGNNNRRGYGDYPSGKATWLKANPTFEGLKQAIKEPAKRSFIGSAPPKYLLVKENRSLFIDKLEVLKDSDSVLANSWLDKTELSLNHDMVAIIGNKGSGKSALADITALLGNSKQNHHFSFLKENRFRGKTGEPAKSFNAKITWVDEQELVKNLNENPATENVELVKYIPQGHFEELCNTHVSGKSNAFENELRSVIFSHADHSIRLGAYDFDQLIEQQESSLRSNLESLRSELHKINWQIASVEHQMTVEVRKGIEGQLIQKKRLFEEHIKTRPPEVSEPTDELSPEQQKATEKLVSISAELEDLKNKREANQEELTNLAAKRKACRSIKEGLEVVNRAVQQFTSEFGADVKLLDLEIGNLIKIEIDNNSISDIEEATSARDTELKASSQQLDLDEKYLTEQKSPLNAQLNAPHQVYQKYLDQLKLWEERKAELEGTKESPDTLEGLKYRKEQLEQLPSRRGELIGQRRVLAGKIFDILEEQRKTRETLFEPIQSLIQNNALIRDEYKLQFSAELSTTIDQVSSKLFSIIKQASGEFRGESESLSVIKDLIDRHDFNDKESVLSFLEELHSKLEGASKNEVGIASILRKDRDAHEVYNFIFSLEYLEPRYTLMFQDAQIEQLSPGQRGALLLIFYLLVDKGNSPIILDQPEENLDNETIVSLLVPVLSEAKQKRQIIMVTHNPNLAVVCDAEQIIHCEFDRTNGHKITYTPGAIECNMINNKVVDVLEGTMPAFDNRRIKYH
ncbi:AAA family ATPase [Microbulbifer sp. MKSA007]|nr:AAA family ATPase [Microbulbifer sp. MKSA007]